ncbi:MULTISPECIES: ImmA/IrrE family metallo-endopeptidase [unclassified Bradyrhizobium]|uniref:ImmA/IrrE family metallo-endopeptidase n=1 Tax=unclassified Bradyrhizobium TaxID=2631580 RepID=UPI001BD156B3|nr:MULTISPECIES: ImmA/IrrE family metallo-endopeptidase [unclassified Bradyrhizobium]WOH52969.1 ImmA/IrrE family metallo-endopeptidase [Bradyrhizobium sp. sBnM-33]
MTDAFSPERWAFEITHVLNTVLGAEHFPINVTAVAQEYSVQKFPHDPISRIVGGSLPGFDGALYKAPAGRKGWGIFYNNRIRSTGRINFTLGHEFGHYLLHRLAYPEGIRCGEQDFVQWDSTYGQIEHQANVFAANLLMPLDDFRRLVPPSSKIDLDVISHCSDRYQVSLIAATLRWLAYTEKRAVLVVSRDGYILWARSSASALKSGAFFRTSAGPIEIPATSLAAQRLTAEKHATKEHELGVWFPEPVTEMTVLSEQYDFAISLLLLSNDPPPFIERAPSLY